ncbi:MAG: class F sortase [Candidatus Pacebacteria bacterium]|nr:class F sortase [Candidatus Paceibacterota bacterium]
MSRKIIIASLLILTGLVVGFFTLRGAATGEYLSFTNDEPLLAEVPEENTSTDLGPIPEEDATDGVTKEDKGLYTLSIPKINVNAVVDAVGITKGGAMATAPNLAHVSWYKYGTTPGGNGTVVLAGHVNNALLLPGTFYRLKDLKVGDSIYISDVNGKQFEYQMTGVEMFGYKDTDTDDVFKNTGTPMLKLITCDGTWIPGEKTYDHRLVVTAKLVT